VHKIKKKLSRWRGRVISFACRICLVKIVITNLPLYYISFYKTPSQVKMIFGKFKEISFEVGVQREEKVACIKG